MTLLEVIAYAPAVVSTTGGLRALWRLVRRKLPGRPPVRTTTPSVAVEAVCRCPWDRVVRYEAADGGVLTVWAVGPVIAAAGRRSQEHGPW